MAPGRNPETIGRLLLWLGLVTVLPGPAWVLAADAAREVAEVHSDPFIRFMADGTDAGRVETAVVRYHRASDGVRVTLFAAVHVGDAGYYRNLQSRFDSCDALLYEMVRERPEQPEPIEPTGDHPISQLQLGMRRLLALEFQLEAVDYARSNFVHADLEPRRFLELQQERQESFLTLMIRVMIEEEARARSGQGAGMSGLDLLMALMDPERSHALKLVLGRQMGDLENLLAGIDDPEAGTESVIVGARNSRAMEVLQEEIGKGRRRLGIFYGAAHMPDFDRRLREAGFERQETEWLTAWDIRRESARPLAPRSVR